MARAGGMNELIAHIGGVYIRARQCDPIATRCAGAAGFRSMVPSPHVRSGIGARLKAQGPAYTAITCAMARHATSAHRHACAAGVRMMQRARKLLGVCVHHRSVPHRTRMPHRIHMKPVR